MLVGSILFSAAPFLSVGPVEESLRFLRAVGKEMV